MLPAWRPDKAMAVENPAAFRAYVDRLAEVSGVEIRSFATLVDALRVRHRFFESVGCRLSDHGIEEFYAEDYTSQQIEAIFAKVYGGETLTDEERRRYKSAMLVEMAVMDWETGWTQQYPLRRHPQQQLAARSAGNRAPIRVSTRSATSRSAKHMARNSSTMLDPRGQAHEDHHSTTSIPRDNELVATMIGNFQDGRYGRRARSSSDRDGGSSTRRTAWSSQMNALSLLGLLSRFVGMLTDSRSVS